MDRSIRDLLMEAVTNLFRQVTKANGYVDDCGLRPYDHYIPATGPSLPPCVMVAEDEEQVVQGDFGRYRRGLPIIVVLESAYAGDAKGERARALLAAAQKVAAQRIQLTVPLLPTEANPNPGTRTVYVDLIERSNVHRIQHASDSKKVGIEVEFDAEYDTARSDPTKH